MLHLNVAEVPGINPVTEVVGVVGELMITLPETTLHPPTPERGVLPLTIALVVLQRF